MTVKLYDACGSGVVQISRACAVRVAAACRTFVRVSFLNNARGLNRDILVSSLPDLSFADQTLFLAALMIRRA